MSIGLEHIIVGSVFSIVGTLIIIQRMFTNKIKLLDLQKHYELELIRTKAAQNRKNQKAKAQLVQHSTAAPKDWIDSLKGIDTGKIKNIIDMVQGDDYQEEGLIGQIGNIVQDNPDLVQGLLDGLSKTTKKEETNINYE